MTIQEGTCDKPHCKMAGTKTYNGPNSNTLSLCDKHYYSLVTGKGTFNIGAETVQDKPGDIDL